jgi:glycosyltransferase involved in cell wall biosynthesis
MKILIIHTDFRLYWVQRLVALNNFLAEMGHELKIIEIAGKGSPYSFASREQPPHGLNWTILFPDSKLEDLNPVLRHQTGMSILESENPDVVVSGAIAFPSGAAAVRWTYLNRKPLVVFDDARLEDIRRSFAVNFIKKVIYKNADAIFCPAPSHLSTYKYFNFKDDQVFYGVDTIDNNWYKKTVGEMRQEVKSCKVPQGKTLLAIGRQVPKKNWIALAKAFVTYKRIFPLSDLKILFIGDGPDHEMLCAIEEQHPKAGITLKTFLQPIEICSYLAEATGLILPSLYGETWGLVVNEAMAAGLPVLVSERCGCADTLVHDSMNGWKFNPMSNPEMVKVLRKFDDLDPEQLKEMGENSQKIISQWGLDRFCSGLWDAIVCARNNREKKYGLLSGIVTSLWKGRYRPN